MNPRILALLVMAAGAAQGAQSEFDRVVKAVESHYGVKRTHIPLMGAANFFVKVARPAGTSGFKLAIFEDLPPVDDNGDLDRLMNEICAGRLHPMVVTHERNKGEATYILTGEVGKATRLLVATFEPAEATVIEVTVNVETMLKMIGSPGKAHEMFGNDHHDGDDGR